MCRFSCIPRNRGNALSQELPVSTSSRNLKRDAQQYTDAQIRFSSASVVAKARLLFCESRSSLLTHSDTSSFWHEALPLVLLTSPTPEPLAAPPLLARLVRNVRNVEAAQQPPPSHRQQQHSRAKVRREKKRTVAPLMFALWLPGDGSERFNSFPRF